MEKRSYLGGPELPVSQAQHWAERGIRWAVIFVAGYGLAIALNHVPDLQAHNEYLSKLIHGEYPGVHVTDQNCAPIVTH